MSKQTGELSEKLLKYQRPGAGCGEGRYVQQLPLSWSLPSWHSGWWAGPHLVMGDFCGKGIYFHASERRDV